MRPRSSPFAPPAAATVDTALRASGTAPGVASRATSSIRLEALLIIPRIEQKGEQHGHAPPRDKRPRTALRRPTRRLGSESRARDLIDQVPPPCFPTPSPGPLAARIPPVSE